MTKITQMSQAEKIAETFGVVLGAASRCEQVSEERLNAVAVKARNAVMVTAHDEADAEAADELFSAAVDAGRIAAEDGKVDPDAVESALSEIEQRLAV
jgi:hypothetical protein